MSITRNSNNPAKLLFKIFLFARNRNLTIKIVLNKVEININLLLHFLPECTKSWDFFTNNEDIFFYIELQINQYYVINIFDF